VSFSGSRSSRMRPRFRWWIRAWRSIGGIGEARPRPRPRPRKKYGQVPDAPDPSFLMVRGILRPRAKGSEGAVAAREASVIRSNRPYGT
jgi:hypothetical protein